MREDRFFLGILIGIGVLVVTALAVFLVRPTAVQYVEDGTAAGVVQDYLTALYTRDYERAYGLIADTPETVSFDIFQQEAQNSLSQNIAETTVEVGAEEVNAGGDAAVVAITIIRGGGFLDDTSRSLQQVNLIRQGGEWKITWAPDPFWIYGWASPVFTEPVPEITQTP